MNRLTTKLVVFLVLLAWGTSVLASPPQPVVAVHFSELTEALETQRASGLTPTGAGTTGYQWWMPAWHYFVMPTALEEALRSDGTLYVEVSDADIAAGRLLNSDGSPRYPILISLASEAVGDTEIAPLRSYVAAGGTLMLGSSALTRQPDGTPRNDFALATEMGLHQSVSGLQNWYANRTFTVSASHRLVSHVPSGTLFWQMPLSAEEIPWGTALAHGENGAFYTWSVQAGTAQVIARGDSGPLLAVKQYGSGWIIYYGAMQPLIGHGGMDAGMYAYGIFRNAIRWAFETANTPIIKLSPWRYPYDAAFTVRHDYENLTNLIGSIETSAQVEKLLGVKGDYYFCTGELRENMGSDPGIIASLKRAVQIDGATIGSHNGGFKNPVDPNLKLDDFFYWHWGPDEVLDVTPAGYGSGVQYATMSIQRSFQDLEGWLAGSGQNRRFWVSPFFNATRDSSYALLQSLGVITVGEQKIGPFPHWTLSTQTSGKRYTHLTMPVSDWFIGSSIVQEVEEHSPQTLHALVDSYYNMGALINLYGHKLSSDPIGAEYITYSLSKPRLWKANSAAIYDWWVARSSASVSGTVTAVNGVTVARANLVGAVDPDTAIEFAIPKWSSGVGSVSKVLLNGVAADPANYRLFADGVRVRVGTSVASVEVDYNPAVIRPLASNDVFYATQNVALTVSAPGVLANDSTAAGKSAVLVSTPVNGTLALNANGSFVYTPRAGFYGTDTFTYKVNDGSLDSNVATVTFTVSPVGALYADDFVRSSDPALASPWSVAQGAWIITGGTLQGGSAANMGANAYIATNWTDYSVQADIKMGPGVYGGGLGGRINPTTGAHYAAWIYPEATPGSPAVLRLYKFTSWWSYALMQGQAAIPSVGSGSHTLKLLFLGNQVSVFLDGAPVASAVDSGIGGTAAFGSGGVGVDLWSGTVPCTISVSNMVVSTSISTAALTVNNDNYSFAAGDTLHVSAPGVLANDVSGSGKALTATLVASPSHGAVTLNPDGSFVYVPTSGFVGSDSFVYRASDGSVTSSNAVVTLSLTGGETLFFDDFTRGADPGPLWPWVAKQGSWKVSGGLLQGSSTPSSYGYACVGGTWTDYSVQAGIKMVGGIYGGGLGGRVDTNSGAHYAAWIYPETTPGGSAVLRLVKFSSWTSFTIVQQVSIPGVGAGLHMLRLDFQGNKISVFLDGASVISCVDSGFGGIAAFANGGISADLWSTSTSSGIALDGVTVGALTTNSPPPLAADDFYNTVAGTRLSVSAPGVLANDTSVSGKSLTAILVSSPSHGTAVLNPDGSFVYTSANGFAGMDSFIYKATDGSLASSNAVVAITVAAAPAPTAANDSYSVVAGSTLAVSAPGVLANDSGAPGKVLSAILVGSPGHGTLALSTNGSFTYMPSNGFAGTDSFVYKTSDGNLASSNAVVTITVAAGGALFYDDFSRPADPGALSPWVAKLGNWKVTGGTLQGTSGQVSYGYACVGGAWTNYSVQAQIEMGAGVYGGGVGGRVNLNTGAHYAAWIYPETTPGYPATLKLVKFSDWWTFTVAQQMSIVPVGVGWHSLKLGFQGNQVSVFVDGKSMMTFVDNGIGGTAALGSGGISAEFWSASVPSGIELESVTVSGSL